MNCNRRNGTSRKSPGVFPSLLSMKNFLLLLTLSLHCLARSSMDIEYAWTNLQKRIFPQFSEGGTSGDWGGGAVAAGQDRADQLSLEPLAVSCQRCQADGAGRLEYDTEFPVRLLHSRYQRMIFNKENVIREAH